MSCTLYRDVTFTDQLALSPIRRALDGRVPLAALRPDLYLATANDLHQRQLCVDYTLLHGQDGLRLNLRKFKGIRRTYHLKKNGRYWRPNCRWMKLWWGREKKWVSLYISMGGLRKVDRFGLEEAARFAGLDLYAWSKEHWEPGSRQPLCLRFGITSQAAKDRKQWPDYIEHLNKGAPLAEKFAGPPKFKKPVPWAVRKMKQQRLEAMGPPPGLKVEMKTPGESMQTESR
ncbi:rpmB [Symbiodinium sp. CCMP2592]|nr:rpmB [Symbiodinium sp. CCMP2592]